jgi:putative transposase
MARQPRFVLPGQPHLLRQRGHNGASIVWDAQDALRWKELLGDVAATQRLAIHAWALHETEFRLLATPADATALSRLLQDLGRRYVGAFNARHGRTGTLWDGRFQCCAVEPGARELLALAYVEYPATQQVWGSSLLHHLGGMVDPALADPPGYWALGNTPFERHAAWRQRVDNGLAPPVQAQLEAALRSGSPWAGPETLGRLQADAARQLFPRPRGRPPRRA